MYIQSNLSIADMLYTGHLAIADTFQRKRPNHGQTLIKNTAYICYGGHFFWTPREHFRQNSPLKSGHPLIGWKKENTWMLLLDTFHYFNMKIIIRFFQAIFQPCYNSYISLKIKFSGISSPNPTPPLALFPVTSTRMWWFVNWRN